MPNLGPVFLIVLGLATAAAIVLAVRNVTPSPKQCRRILQRWGIPAPTDEQCALAAGYIRQRQKMYPWLFIGVGVICYFAIGPDPFLIVLTTILTGLVIGELSAVLRPAIRSRHEAVLVRRRVTDLVPRLSLVLYGLTVVLTLASLVATLVATRGNDQLEPRYLWVTLAGFVLFVAAVVGVLWLSLVRGQVLDDGKLDAALRIRSARLSVGVGHVLVAGVCYVTSGWIFIFGGMLVLLVAAVNFVVLLNPSRTPKLIEISRTPT